MPTMLALDDVMHRLALEASPGAELVLSGLRHSDLPLEHPTDLDAVIEAVRALDRALCDPEDGERLSAAHPASE